MKIVGNSLLLLKAPNKVLLKYWSLIEFRIGSSPHILLQEQHSQSVAQICRPTYGDFMEVQQTCVGLQKSSVLRFLSPGCVGSLGRPASNSKVSKPVLRVVRAAPNSPGGFYLGPKARASEAAYAAGWDPEVARPEALPVTWTPKVSGGRPTLILAT